MGGNALKKVETRRLRAQEYRVLANRAVDTLSAAWPGARPHLLRSYAAKQDFGDIDLIVDADGLPQDVRASLCSLFGSTEVFENVAGRNMAWSCDFEGAQLDIIGMAAADYPTAIVYYSDNDLGSLMGCVANRMGFKYGHAGLSYQLRDGSRLIADLEVSRDPARIFEFLGYSERQYDFARFERGFGSLEEIFRFVASSRFFSPDAFLPENRNARRRARDRSRKHYVAFVDWVIRRQLAPGWGAELPPASHLVRAKMLFPQFAMAMTAAYRSDAAARRRAGMFNGYVIAALTGVTGADLGRLIEHLKGEVGHDQTQFDHWLDTLSGSSDPALAEFVRAGHARWLQGLKKGPANSGIDCRA